jgi:hypothetical protein
MLADCPCFATPPWPSTSSGPSPLAAHLCRSSSLIWVDPAIGVLLTDRDYRLTSFENVLGLALKGEPERVTPPGVEVRPSGEDEFEPWLDVMADGFAHADAQGVSSPAHRRRGVQTALLSARLADATAAGCDIVRTARPAPHARSAA